MPGDENIIDEAVVRVGPDLSGFRRKLERELKTQIAGIGAEIPVKLNESKTRESLNYVAGLRAKYLKEQLNRTRNANENIQRAQDQARQHELKQERSFQETLDRLHRRAQEQDLARVRSTSEKISQAREQAGKADAQRQMAQTRNLAEKVVKAHADAQRAEQTREAGRLRNAAEKLEKERADADRANREREAQRTRTAAEALEKQIGDAVVAEREREARRVRSIAEAAERTQAQAQEANLTRERQKYRNHQEYLDALHRAAIDESVTREQKASNSRMRVIAAEGARRKKMFSDLRKSEKFIDYGGKGIKPINLLYGVVTAMTPALFSMGASALQASTSIAALGSAGIGAALGLSAVAIGFQGIGDALSLRKTVLGQETTEAANSAREAVTAADDLAQSKRALADAQRDEKAAYADIHKSRREAIRDLQDLRQAVVDLDNQYRSDVISVSEARENAAATDRNFFATALDRARAHQDLRDAQTRLSDTRLERRQKKEDLKQSLAKGIEGSDKVRDAKERARDARDRTLDAQNALRKSATGVAGGMDKTSSAAAQLEKKLAELSPAARKMYYWFINNENLFKRLQREISQKTLPGFQKFLDAITATPKGGKSTLQLAADYAGDLGAIIGKYAGKFGKFTQSPLFRDAMARMQLRNAAAFDKLGEALLTLADPITRILDKAAPGFESLADTVLRLSKSFAKWIEGLDKNGGLAKWFEDSRAEAKKWYDIASNILELLKNLFTASLPTGSTLVTNFQKFTQTLADWSGSTQGQQDIKDFFQFFKDLPYAKIADFFKNSATFFAAFRTFKFLKTLNPFFAALGAFAAANPGAAATAMSSIATALTGVMQYAAAHPDAVAALLALLAAAKVGKAIGFDIKIPALTGIRNLLTSKFKVLDKFIGGGATTGTMTVHAGVVNVYGKTLTGGGTGGIDVDGKGKGTGKGPGGRLGNLLGTETIITAAALAGFAIGMDELDRAKEILSGKNKDAFHTWNDAITKKPFDWDNWYKTFVDNSAIVSVPLIAKNLLGGKKKKTPLSTAMGDENLAMARLKNNLESFGKDSNVTKSAMDTYIAARRKSVEEYVKYIRSTQGPLAADLAQQAQDKESRRVLSGLMQQYGWTKAAADVYTKQVFNTATQTQIAADKAITASKSFDSMGNSIDTTKTKAEQLDGQVNTLQGTIAATIGPHVIGLETKDYDKTLQQLLSLYKVQNVLYNPMYSNSASGADTISSQNQFIDPKTGLPKVYMKARGGYIRGPGTTTSDSIPARLSDGEYVMPAKAVKHYGLGVMESMRKRRMPGFAEGGAVMPFQVAAKDITVPVLTAPYIAAPGEGKAVGDVGVAELAEATARKMGATTKQLIALISAGIVESGLRNINFGDRDSVGFLQQRPSQGWGSIAQLLDPAYATRKFIQSARQYDKPGITAGELAARVQRPAAEYRGRYALREADAVAVLNRLAPYLEGAGLDVGTPGAGGTKAGLVAFGRWLQARGYQVGEHPSFGGVDPVHGPGSQHYRASAIDVNHGFGTSASEQAWLRKILPEGHRRGFRSIFMVPDHFDHAHFDLGQGHKAGGLVRKFDTGGTLPPGYTLAYNGTGRTETIRTHEQEKALTTGTTRLDRRDIALLAHHMAAAVGSPAVTMDGRKVAETTNRYNYLPAGV